MTHRMDKITSACKGKRQKRERNSDSKHTRLRLNACQKILSQHKSAQQTERCATECYNNGQPQRNDFLLGLRQFSVKTMREARCKQSRNIDQKQIFIIFQT